MTTRGCAIGTDVVTVTEVTESLSRFGERYLRRVFTDREVADAGGASYRLAARFAAKEAVIKLFRDPSLATPLTDIEVVLQDGLPTLRLHGALADLAAARWGSLEVSLSHTDCHAVAVVHACALTHADD